MGAFICSPQKLSEGLEECLRTRIETVRGIIPMECGFGRRFGYSLHAYAWFFFVLAVAATVSMERIAKTAPAGAELISWKY
jgi:hypothetical protein